MYKIRIKLQLFPLYHNVANTLHACLSKMFPVIFAGKELSNSILLVFIVISFAFQAEEGTCTTIQIKDELDIRIFIIHLGGFFATSFVFIEQLCYLSYFVAECLKFRINLMRICKATF